MSSSIKTASFALWVVFSLTMNAFAMEKEDTDAFKIKFAAQKVTVKTSNGEYVESTWEQAIPNQGLAEASVEEGCKIDPQGMCCSHAVVCALEYCHNRSDLLASYLHKAVTGGYDKGMDLKEAMNFVKNNGVMALPPGQTVKHGSGLPWPEGPRYTFTKVIDADSRGHFSFVGISSDKASLYKSILREHNHPIVVSILSGYKGHPDKSPFLKYRGTDRKDNSTKFSETKIQSEPVPSNAQKLYHAIILYGFRESSKCFFVKNSWGPERINGLCTLPYDFINEFAISAFVGLGHKDSQGEGIKAGQDDSSLVEQGGKCLAQ